MTNSKPLTIQDIPANERPRERLLQHGPASLTNAELIAILLRTGTAQENAIQLATRLLAQTDGLAGLATISATQIKEIHGLGDAKAAQLLAAVELGRRLASSMGTPRICIQSAADAANLLTDMSYLKQEQIRVILLDTANQVMAIRTIYTGTVNVSIVRISELFREAIIENSPAIILAHNHPSGNPSPSPEDVALTRELIAASKLLDIAVLDHLIIGHQRWYSFQKSSSLFDA
ncbi:DNA repair protein RadC [Phototrophicus methaneseepsis]|uniref:DNA repair protein RadC n=1 Tax=Phototrophicus methaneseepsis TaxID=2710758 RepID=A0A7S8ID87_9CHLR|nr:DNA repair protein RadC [Phototrophicus methaneseepsis]QPC81119.1 DNA repair protein RadC [Phototrophicus methaneseepsis]